MRSFMKSLKKENKGFSLLELIVIVLIIGILSTTTLVAVSNMYNARVTAARNRVVSLLSNARTATIAKADGTIWFEISKDSDGDYYGTIYEGTKYDYTASKKLSEDKLGNDRLTIKVKNADGTSKEVDSSNSVIFDFVKSTGALDEDYTDVEISNNSRTSNIIVINETGRCIRDE